MALLSKYENVQISLVAEQIEYNHNSNLVVFFLFLTIIRLVYDESTMTMKNAPGVETRVPGFGETSTIEYLDTTGLIKYFAPMVETLVSWGYQRGETVRAAPYDFRYGPGKLHVNSAC